MAIITLRIDDEAKEELEVIAATARISVSELARQAIDMVLNRSDDVGGPKATLPMPNLIERATLGMLHEILSRLDEDKYDSEHHEKMAEVLARGYSGEYSHLFYNLDRGLTLNPCQSVWDTLDLFRTIKASMGKLTDTQRNQYEKHEIEFGGFDGNSAEESLLLSYAKYLIEDGRWQELSEYFDEKHEEGNSHHTTMPRYRAMTAKWHQIRRDKSRGKISISFDDLFLTPEEIEMILEAGRLGNRSN